MKITSGSTSKIADIIDNYLKKKFKVIVVSSAMSGVTNELIKKSKKICTNFSDRFLLPHFSF